MIPSEYRLERVTAGLIERLDGARRSYDDPEKAGEAFARMAEAYVDAAAAEWRELAWAPDPEPHAAFLRTEVHETFLPRFTRAAMAANTAESNHFGLGWWGSPAGRVALVAIALAVLWFVLFRMIALPVVWPLILLDLALPFLPDLIAMAQNRRYETELREIIGDMSRIQNQQLTFQATGSPLDAEPTTDDALAEARRMAAAKRQHDAP